MDMIQCPDCGMLLSAGGHPHQCAAVKGSTAPRVTQRDIEAAIAETYVFNVWQAVTSIGEWRGSGGPVRYGAEELRRLTLVTLVLKNGYVVIGESACADIANYDAELGARLAIEDAKSKIWPLLGYSLKERLYEAALDQPADDR